METTRTWTTDDQWGIACSYLGWGDPDGGFWFIGIEESVPWDLNELQRIDAIPRDRSGARHDFPRGATWEDWNTGTGKGQILPYTAKICAARSETFGDWKNDWQKYKRERLFTAGSKVFQGNLFPIGRRDTAAKHNQLQSELFGAAVETDASYRKSIRETRFPIIRASWALWKPLATICFVGKAHRKDISEALGIPDQWDDLSTDGLLQVHVSAPVIITPHFSRVGMSDRKVQAIVSKVEDWDAVLP
jgi:hypothetical protein